MISHTPAQVSDTLTRVNHRRRFLAAVALFLAWVVFLLVLGIVSATGPRRSGSSIEVESLEP